MWARGDWQTATVLTTGDKYVKVRWLTGQEQRLHNPSYYVKYDVPDVDRKQARATIINQLQEMRWNNRKAPTSKEMDNAIFGNGQQRMFDDVPQNPKDYMS